MNEQLVKRTAETTLFDINCDAILAPGEAITAVISMSGEGQGAALTFGIAQINTTAITHSYGRMIAAGRVIQVLIGGGSIPPPCLDAQYVGRVLFTTTNPGEIREATFRLLVRDEP